MSKPLVFDSFALLAFLKGEKGAEIVYKFLKRVKSRKAFGYISAVNLGEVYYITWREKGKEGADIVLGSVKEWGVKIVTADENVAKEAGKFKAEFPLALADAFAAATAEGVKGIIVTGDPEFKQLKDIIPIQWLN